ncbi:MAG: hypothetical protein AAF417_23520, partial [Pseudomonadota bacterium]
MATAANDPRLGGVEQVADRAPLLSRVARFIKRQPLGTCGLLIVLVMIIAAFFAPWIAPFDPEENNFESMFVAPGATHLLGTDEFGRDIFSRIVWGARRHEHRLEVVFLRVERRDPGREERR